jgi:HD-GYP domain-containing protein (c-di-GMP phosphodiesterase class II)
LENENFEVSGLKFAKEQLETIKIEEIEKINISPGHLFYLSAKLGKPFLMLRAGDVITNEFIDKYKKKGFNSFYILYASNRETIDQYKAKLQNLKTLVYEKDLIETKTKIVNDFRDTFILGIKESNTLDFYIAYFETFNRNAPSIHHEIMESSVSLYTRSLQLSAFSVVLSLMSGYHDFNFLQDIYNASFLLDIGIIGSSYTYTIAQACEGERYKPGSGITYLQKKSTPAEVEIFEKHPITSRERALSELHESFNYKEVLNLIEVHHEKTNGTGFPAKLTSSEISDWESVVIFLDFVIPFSDVIFEKNDGGQKFIEYLEFAFGNYDFELFDFYKLINKILLLVPEDKKREFLEDRVA